MSIQMAEVPCGKELHKGPASHGREDSVCPGPWFPGVLLPGKVADSGSRNLLAHLKTRFRVKMVGKNFIDRSAEVCGYLHTC